LIHCVLPAAFAAATGHVSLSAGGTRARGRYRLLKDLFERLGAQERYSPGCGFRVCRLQPAGVCGLKSEHVPNIHFLLACRRSSGGVDSRLFGKLDPNALISRRRIRMRTSPATPATTANNLRCLKLPMSWSTVRKKTSPYGMTASIRRRISAATNPNLVLAIMASSNWRVVRNRVWLCATLVLVRRQILAATGTSVTALSTLFVGCRAWPLLLFS